MFINQRTILFKCFSRGMQKEISFSRGFLNKKLLYCLNEKYFDIFFASDYAALVEIFEELEIKILH